MYYFLLIIFALLPSFIWLLFFLRKDSHPESNQMILKVFFWGMLATLPIISFSLLIELLGFTEDISKFLSSSALIQILYFFLGIALVEEILKYLVVSGKVLRNSELDEPSDLMLYMIIAALGFAALENILYLFGQKDVSDVFLLNIFRFLAPVFGHALWSGTLGYFLALSLYEPKQKLKLLTLGIALAAFLHAVFNCAIIRMMEIEWLLLIIIMLIGLAIFVTLGFKRLQKMKSICKIK